MYQAPDSNIHVLILKMKSRAAFFVGTNGYGRVPVQLAFIFENRFLSHAQTCG